MPEFPDSTHAAIEAALIDIINLLALFSTVHAGDTEEAFDAFRKSAREANYNLYVILSYFVSTKSDPKQLAAPASLSGLNVPITNQNDEVAFLEKLFSLGEPDIEKDKT